MWHSRRHRTEPSREIHDTDRVIVITRVELLRRFLVVAGAHIAIDFVDPRMTFEERALALPREISDVCSHFLEQAEVAELHEGVTEAPLADHEELRARREILALPVLHLGVLSDHLTMDEEARAGLVPEWPSLGPAPLT